MSIDQAGTWRSLTRPAAVPFIDLRSDILTRPTDKMIAAMMGAAKSPCAFGYREDPVVRELEEHAADLLGMEDALFLPTCTLANQIAIRLACPPGTSVLADRTSHIATTELAATCGLSSVVLNCVSGNRGHLSAQQVATALRREASEPLRRTRLIVLENTHNRAGGTVMPTGWQAEIGDLARERGIAVHLDGARLWNASAHDRRAPSELVRGADTVAASLNKALGAPLGAVFAGRRDLIEEANRIRIMLGAGWRPAGIIAAAGIVAIKMMNERLFADHHHARRLAEELASIPSLVIDLELVQTNIILIGVQVPIPSSAELISALERNGVRVLPSGDGQIRLVLHSEIRESDLERIAARFEAAVREAAGSRVGSR